MKLLYLLVVLNIIIGLCMVRVVHNLSRNVQQIGVTQ